MPFVLRLDVFGDCFSVSFWNDLEQFGGTGWGGTVESCVWSGYDDRFPSLLRILGFKTTKDSPILSNRLPF
ncbi:hypothetical protein KIS1582_0999 [Cytobacillus firmus]|uniref:Uncharacterized protein n=1 Tax=Cytobacillus firmus TaxID=1399 RepID=A0A800NE57_CYTFI|nr:hypothetical protein KIS1582_0999 [Cytobacillus firmus]